MKVYIYVTKGGKCLCRFPPLAILFGKKFHLWSKKNLSAEPLNGKIIASFELNEAESISQKYAGQRKDGHFYDVLEKACLTAEELEKYCPTGSKKEACAWYIESLQILDEPFNLGDFAKDRAPQSWGYATINGAKCVLVSIRPEWACKILNGEKTIEVRKSAPKGVKV
jgi:hypothetical protein